MAKLNVTTLKTQPQLTDEELNRLAERLAQILEYDSQDIALVSLLLDHLAQSRHLVDVVNATDQIKQHMFINTSASTRAQKQFEANAYKNRGKLLRWPNEGRAK